MKSLKILITCVMIVLFSSIFLAEEGCSLLDFSNNQVQDVGGAKVSGSGVDACSSGKLTLNGEMQIGNYDVDGKIVDGNINSDGTLFGTASDGGVNLETENMGFQKLSKGTKFSLDKNGVLTTTGSEGGSTITGGGDTLELPEGEIATFSKDGKVSIKGTSESSMMLKDGWRIEGKVFVYDSNKNTFNSEGYAKVISPDGVIFHGKDIVISVDGGMTHGGVEGFFKAHQGKNAGVIEYDNPKGRTIHTENAIGTIANGNKELPIKTTGTPSSKMSRTRTLNGEEINIPKGKVYVGTDYQIGVKEDSLTAKIGPPIKSPEDPRRLSLDAGKTNLFARPGSNNPNDIQMNDIIIKFDDEVVHINSKPDFVRYIRTGSNIPIPESPPEIDYVRRNLEKEELLIKYETPYVVDSETILLDDGTIYTTVNLDTWFSEEMIKDGFRDLAYVSGLEGQDYWKVLEGIDTVGHVSSTIIKPNGEIIFSPNIPHTGSEPSILISQKSARLLINEQLNPIKNHPKIKDFLKNSGFDYIVK